MPPRAPLTLPVAATPEVVALVAHLVEGRAGLHYSVESTALLADKVASRALELGFDALLDYYYFLKYDAGGEGELTALVERLLVHESYLFREAEALRVATREFVAPAARSRGRARVWSAACASGEEVYTLAMVLEGEGLLDRVDLVASDLSEAALSRARRGAYAGRALRALPPEAERHLVRREGAVEVDPRLRAAVEWRRVNLVDADAVAALGGFDLVLCRNALMYFSDATARAVVASLAATLRPEGRILVGASESLLRFGSVVTCEERGGCFFYRARVAP
ncbi:MAG: CheR family methyltransferase [Polyangiales bacterium]